ncbi:MAG: zinc-binding dehydrogenase, partial [Candidatus Bathyarchaeia archaeon]
KDLRVENVDVPEVGLGEVLVRVRAATTCGTDIKIFRRGYIGGVIKYPTIFGHEWAGDVMEVGEGVPRIREGMRVRAGNSGPCLRCRMCMRGMYNLCENMTWLWGSYAEYIRVPAPITAINTQEVPSHITYEEAAVTEPLACCLHGLEKCGIGLGDTVAVIGDGPIGLLHLQLARSMGAGSVIVCGLIERRLRVAEGLGADVTVDAGEEDSVGTVRRLTDGYGADVVIEAVGLPSTWEQALRMVGKGGRALMFGGCPPGTEVRIETEFVHYGEVTILGTFHATPTDFRKALSLISSGVVRVKPIVTRRMGLNEIGEALELLGTTKDELKIAILP